MFKIAYIYTDSSKVEVTIKDLIAGTTYIFSVKPLSRLRKGNITVSKPYTVPKDSTSITCTPIDNSDIRGGASANTANGL